MISFQLLLFRCVSLALVLRPTIVHAVPPDYCLHQLNTSDCGGRPTPVFSYYKPGSRCELSTWRGCPTSNKFDDQVECSNTCIFRYGQIYDEIMKYIYKSIKIKTPATDEPQTDWEEKIKSLRNEDIENIQKLLNVIDNDNITITYTSETTEQATTLKYEDKLKSTIKLSTTLATTNMNEVTDKSTISENIETTQPNTIPTTQSRTKATTEPSTVPITEFTTVATIKTIAPTVVSTEDSTTVATTKTTIASTTEVTTTESTTEILTTTHSTTTEGAGEPEEVIAV